MMHRNSLLLCAISFMAGVMISQLLTSKMGKMLGEIEPLQDVIMPFSGNQINTVKEDNLPLSTAVKDDNLQLPSPGNMPVVYMYSEGGLKHVPDFCKLTPPFDFAEMDTEQGPIHVYINPFKPGAYTVGSVLKKTRNWEPDIMKATLAELKKNPDAGFIDIGSNIGPFSLVAAKMGRRVVTVDAIADNIQKVCRSVIKNKFTDRVKMVANPVFDVHKTVVLKPWPPRSYEVTQILNSPRKDAIASQTVMLDDLIPLLTFKSAVMKVDVESFEYYVMNGGKNFFAEINVPSIIMEWEHVKKKDKAGDLVNLLKLYQYVPFSIESGETRQLDYGSFMTWSHDIVLMKQT